MRALLFAGQGVQVVGMGARAAEAVPTARRLFDAASEVLGYNLLSACTHGPQALLDSTAVCQPAILTSSLAAVELLVHERGEEMRAADVVCGLSLGEYSALVYAGALQFEDAVEVVRVRGEAMQAASEVVGQASSMVSVVGAGECDVREICYQASSSVGDDIVIANFLGPGNFTLSGSLAACNEVESICSERDAVRAVRLAVSGGFHSEFMRPACDALRTALQAAPLERTQMSVLRSQHSLRSQQVRCSVRTSSRCPSSAPACMPTATRRR